MRWPPWSSADESDKNGKERPKWTDTLNATDWSHYTDPRTVIPTIILTTTCLLSARLYRSYLRRIPQAVSIQPTFWRRRSLFGQVTSVGDGDNFRLFHTPGGSLAGWGWLPWRRVPSKRENLKNKTVRFPSWCSSALKLGRFTSASPALTPPSSLILGDPLNPIPKRHSTGSLHILCIENCERTFTRRISTIGR